MSTTTNMNNANWVNKQLEAYGSRTSGSLSQRQQRLRRFMDTDKTPVTPRKKDITYEPLRILAKVASEAKARDDEEVEVEVSETGEQDEESEYEPSTEGEDDDISLAPTEEEMEYEDEDEDEVDDEDLIRHEAAIHDTWNIYMESNGSTQDRALHELQQLIHELQHIRKMMKSS